MAALVYLLLLVLPVVLSKSSSQNPGCRIRITSKGLQFVKHEGLKFVEQELENITIPDVNGSEGRFSYSINKRVYDFLASFITTGMRFLLNQQICPALRHAGMVLLNSMLNTVPVKNPVDDYIGIDYSLLSDPDVSEDSLDMDFRGMFYSLNAENDTIPNTSPALHIKQKERMVYIALSEYFFDSAMYAYYQSNILSLEIANEQMPKDLEVLLRTSYFGSLMLLDPEVADAPMKLDLRVSTPPRFTIKPTGTSVSVNAILNIYLIPEDQPPVQLSSMTMESRLSAKVTLKKTTLQVQLDLKRFRIYSNKSALESLALIPLQGPLKTLLQLTVMPVLNERTKRGVSIPLPEGLDFTRETTTHHTGFILIGGDLHFSMSLREVIEKNRPIPTAPAETTQGTNEAI
ncbi:phospholipid transfer protein isoform X2 [Dendrobates tinctorius]|uniref:phospholipid transfer protein isoform X2 n=1 Tax=Dendrobates tinctorius TaxID=92724 RepID=UPI003CC9CCD8